MVLRRFFQAGDVGKEHVFFFRKMGKHLEMKLLDQQGDRLISRRLLAMPGGDPLREFNELRQLAANDLMVDANNMLNQAREGISFNVRRRHAVGLRFSVAKLFKNLVYGQLQLGADAFKFRIGLRAEIDLEAFKYRCSRWFSSDNLTDRLGCGGHAFTLQMKL